MPLAAVLPLMLLICVLVDRLFSFNFCAMAHEMRFTCDPGSHKHLTSNVLPCSSVILATMVASSANELGSASQSVRLLQLPVAAFVVGWLVVAVHSNPLCLMLHLLHARNVHLSGEQLRFKQFRHSDQRLTRSCRSVTVNARNCVQLYKKCSLEHNGQRIGGRTRLTASLCCF